jgi:signal transduction histidine kinase
VVVWWRNEKELPVDASTNGAQGTQSDWLVLEVRDSGSGMDEVTKAHIFEPF